MMNIFVNAIEKSKHGQTQYVLQKGLEYVTCIYGLDLLKYLKEEWTIAGIFHNGIEEANYVIEDKQNVSAIKRFLNLFNDAPILIIGIQTHFDMFYNAERQKGHVTFFKGQNENDSIHLDTKKVNELEHFIRNVLFVKQYSNGLIKKLEKDFKEG